MTYYKKVEASQFLLTDDEKEAFKKGKQLAFEGDQVRAAGGNQYQVTMQKGENIVRIQETQWLVKHPDGLWQIYWPEEFKKQFVTELQIMDRAMKENEPKSIV